MRPPDGTMNDTLLLKSIFLYTIFWGIGVALVWFRPRLEIFWKIVATLVYAFYLWFFFDELKTGYASASSDWYVYLVRFIKELVTLVYVNLFLFWPVALVLIYFKADAIGAEKLLKFMCILTLVLWVLFIAYFFYSKGIDDFLFDGLKKMIPRGTT